MEKLSAVDLMSLSIGIEQQRLEAVTSNLSAINQTFETRVSAEGAKSVNVDDFPSIYDVIAGQSENMASSDIKSDPSKTKKVLIFEGDKTSFKYGSDVKIEEEMIRLNEATRAYEASIRLFNINKEMSGKIIRIGSKG